MFYLRMQPADILHSNLTHFRLLRTWRTRSLVVRRRNVNEYDAAFMISSLAASNCVLREAYAHSVVERAFRRMLCCRRPSRLVLKMSSTDICYRDLTYAVQYRESSPSGVLTPCPKRVHHSVVTRSHNYPNRPFTATYDLLSTYYFW